MADVLRMVCRRNCSVPAARRVGLHVLQHKTPGGGGRSCCDSRLPCFAQGNRVVRGTPLWIKLARCELAWAVMDSLLAKLIEEGTAALQENTWNYGERLELDGQVELAASKQMYAHKKRRERTTALALLAPYL